MRRTAEDRAGTIVHQHEIGDEHRQQDRRVERVDDAQAGVVAAFLGALDVGGRGARRAAFGDEIGQRRVGRGTLGGERMIGGEGSEARAEQRVGARGEDVERAAARDLERKPQPLRLADPVLLH